MADTEATSLRNLPAVASVLATPGAVLLVERHGRAATTDAIRTVTDEARRTLRVTPSAAPDATELASRAKTLLEAHKRGLRPLFNLTGTVLHTNLGRALLADAAIDAA